MSVVGLVCAVNPESPLMSVCGEQGNESDSDEGSPRRTYVPLRSSPPTPVPLAKKVKVNPAHVAQAKAQVIEECQTPEEFVKQIVYEEFLRILLSL